MPFLCNKRMTNNCRPHLLQNTYRPYKPMCCWRIGSTIAKHRRVVAGVPSTQDLARGLFFANTESM